MAESIIIHFCETDSVEVVARMDARFGPSAQRIWRYPTDDYLFQVHPYEAIDSEYEPSERAALQAGLGVDPTTSFDFEIRRSRSDEACDALESFVRNDLRGLKFVVDDMQRLISHSELDESHDFLDLYRYKKLQNKSQHPTA